MEEKRATHLWFSKLVLLHLNTERISAKFRCLFNYALRCWKILVICCSSVLTSISGKRVAVPAHVGCSHIIKFYVNPEKDAKTNRSFRLDTDIVQSCSTGCCVCLLPFRRDSQVFVEQATQKFSVCLVFSSAELANTSEGAECNGLTRSSKRHHLVRVDMHTYELVNARQTQKCCQSHWVDKAWLVFA